MIIGIIGSGTMGSSIAQFFAQNNQIVYLYDSNLNNLIKAEENIKNNIQNLINKNKISELESKTFFQNIQFINELNKISKCELIIEAIIEDLAIKKLVFTELEKIVSDNCILCSNTSSLSIASISSCLKNPTRFLGLHFFNPATIMKLVEIIPSIQTDINIVEFVKNFLSDLGKVPALCKDTPGFIVNRIARPFYGEALRIYEEGIANFETIDFAMKELGKFKMGPFELMDYIGNDINYAVTESVFSSFYFDPRFKPSFTQKRYVEAGLLGRKSKKGFYSYENEIVINIDKSEKLLEEIFNRIISMLINEAYDALYLKIANKYDIDIAMKLGVNYPKGLIEWSEVLGVSKICSILNKLFKDYGEDRYRPNILLKRIANNL